MILMKGEGEERKRLKILSNMTPSAALETNETMWTRCWGETNTEQLKGKEMETRGRRGGRDAKSYKGVNQKRMGGHEKTS